MTLMIFIVREKKELLVILILKMKLWLIFLNNSSQDVHVGDIIQYHRIGFVCCNHPLVTSTVLEITTSSLGDNTCTIELCNSEMVP